MLHVIDLNYHWRWIDENFVTVPNTSKLKLTRTRVKARTITLVRGAEEVVCRFGEDLYLQRCTSPESILEAEVVSAFDNLIVRASQPYPSDLHCIRWGSAKHLVQR